METFVSLLLLAGVSFIQNCAFTWTSRSRNSGDPNYHRYASYASNGIWYTCQMLIVSAMWKPLLEGDWTMVFIGGIIYVISTAEGSVFMMKLLLGHINVPFLTNIFLEKNKRQVGKR
jgi:hypothetical protein